MVERVPAQRISKSGTIPVEEIVAVEEPLEIRINGTNWVTTMRTPGEDNELITGLIYTEGIISNHNEVVEIRIDGNEADVSGDFDINSHQRGFVRSSSCGICGRASLDAMLLRNPPKIPENGFQIPPTIIHEIIDNFRDVQPMFGMTGGVHAVALFDTRGNISQISEDVGRHNAMDKVIGGQIDNLPLYERGFILSGRVSFEMMQKAVICGCPAVVAIGAPTTLAIELARQHGITLVGFVREGRFNVYTGAWRIKN